MDELKSLFNQSNCDVIDIFYFMIVFYPLMWIVNTLNTNNRNHLSQSAFYALRESELASCLNLKISSQVNWFLKMIIPVKWFLITYLKLRFSFCSSLFVIARKRESAPLLILEYITENKSYSCAIP